MNAALARRPATPYARRLARERGLALAVIVGTGPGNRIVGADVEAHVERPAAASAAAAATVSAFAATVDLSAVRKLLADVNAARIVVDLDDMLVRAAALALEAVSGADDGPAGIGVAWEAGARTSRQLIVLADAHRGLVSALHQQLAAGRDGGAAGSLPSALSIRRIAQSGIRPAAVPLLPGHVMRLVVAADEQTASAECLLCFRADAIGEDRAAALLARFRDGIEAPLRLLA